MLLDESSFSIVLCGVNEIINSFIPKLSNLKDLLNFKSVFELD